MKKNEMEHFAWDAGVEAIESTNIFSQFLTTRRILQQDACGVDLLAWQHYEALVVSEYMLQDVLHMKNNMECFFALAWRILQQYACREEELIDC